MNKKELRFELGSLFSAMSEMGRYSAKKRIGGWTVVGYRDKECENYRIWVFHDTERYKSDDDIEFGDSEGFFDGEDYRYPGSLWHDVFYTVEDAISDCVKRWIEYTPVAEELASLFSDLLESEYIHAQKEIGGKTVVVYLDCHTDYYGTSDDKFGIRVFYDTNFYESEHVTVYSDIGLFYGQHYGDEPAEWFDTVKEAIVDCLDKWDTFVPSDEIIEEAISSDDAFFTRVYLEGEELKCRVLSLLAKAEKMAMENFNDEKYSCRAQVNSCKEDNWQDHADYKVELINDHLVLAEWCVNLSEGEPCYKIKILKSLGFDHDCEGIEISGSTAKSVASAVVLNLDPKAPAAEDPEISDDFWSDLADFRAWNDRYDELRALFGALVEHGSHCAKKKIGGKTVVVYRDGDHEDKDENEKYGVRVFQDTEYYESGKAVAFGEGKQHFYGRYYGPPAEWFQTVEKSIAYSLSEWAFVPSQNEVEEDIANVDNFFDRVYLWGEELKEKVLNLLDKAEDVALSHFGYDYGGHAGRVNSCRECSQGESVDYQVELINDHLLIAELRVNRPEDPCYSIKILKSLCFDGTCDGIVLSGANVDRVADAVVERLNPEEYKVLSECLSADAEYELSASAYELAESEYKMSVSKYAGCADAESILASARSKFLEAISKHLVVLSRYRDAVFKYESLTGVESAESAAADTTSSDPAPVESADASLSSACELSESDFSERDSAVEASVCASMRLEYEAETKAAKADYYAAHAAYMDVKSKHGVVSTEDNGVRYDQVIARLKPNGGWDYSSAGISLAERELSSARSRYLSAKSRYLSAQSKLMELENTESVSAAVI
jgi:hypothetical protein